MDTFIIRDTQDLFPTHSRIIYGNPVETCGPIPTIIRAKLLDAIHAL